MLSTNCFSFEMEIHQKAYTFSSSFCSVVIFLSIFSPVSCGRRVGVSTHDFGVDEHEPLQAYIVRVQPPADVADAGSGELESRYRSFLSESTSSGAGDREPRLLRSYSEVFVGFAARLTRTELDSMRKKEWFVHAFPDRVLRLQTTHTPAFLGLRPGAGLWNATALGRGVVIGLLDTGIAPAHPSFSDDGVPRPPAKWKGACEFAAAAAAGCNNKLVGARSFVEGDASAFDGVGHGTHTASTAGGNFVEGAGVYGQAGGTASGVAPHAHLAMYKVCNASGCLASDVLAGLDAAVKDGVDVISISLGAGSVPFKEDVISIGAFGAFQKGIIVSCAAGNDGPVNTSLSNEAPWYITVGAASVDRSFRSSVRLDNGQVYEGEALNQLVALPSNATFGLAYNSSLTGCTFFRGFDVEGKIVICDPFFPAQNIARAVRKAGGVGVLIANPPLEGYSIFAKAFDLPSSGLSAADTAAVISYASSDPGNNPKASIVYNGTVLGTSPAPVVAFFSSRGPNFQAPLILKPDVSAPGLNILAAWPTRVDGGSESGAKTFNVVSGTSMATPHVSGVAALIRSAHPDWSAAAVKSAIVTTADENGQDGEPILDELHRTASFFAAGAGHVNPSKAADPGLIYDIEADEFVGFICSVYGDAGARVIVRSRNVSCSTVAQKSAAELNLPSIVASPPWLLTVRE